MFSINPFAELSALIPSAILQGYIVLMFVLVVGGTILDMMHKKSAQYFFENAEKAKKNAKRTLSGGEKAGLAVATVANEVLTSAEFKSARRRLSHLLTMYGFVIFVVTTVWLIFCHTAQDASAAPTLLTGLWHIGAIMLCLGGYWFWFFIRVDVASEGNPWHRIVRADLFILSLLASTTSALLWSLFQGSGFLGGLFLLVFIISSTVLFCGVIWSKFAHMFFKPAAAFQKRVAQADGSLDNLPEPADRTNPADRDRHSMELLKDAPLNMGLGIKREQPHHY